MTRLGKALLLFLVTFHSLHAAELQFELLDHKKRPIANGEIALLGDDPLRWKSLESGVTRFEDSAAPTGFVLRAEGQPAFHGEWKPDGPSALRAQFDEPFRCSIEVVSAEPLPAGFLPIVFSAQGYRPVLRSLENETVPPEYLRLNPETAGRFTFIRAFGEPVYILVHHPGFLRAFLVGPFPGENEELRLRLPKRGGVEYALEPEDEESASKAREIVLSRVFGEGTGHATKVILAKIAAPAGSAKGTWEDLAPGNYEVTSQLAGTEGKRSVKSKTVAVIAGQTGFVPLGDKTVRARFAGEYAAAIQVRRFDGGPASALPYSLVHIDPQDYQVTPITDGISDANGQIRLERLARGIAMQLDLTGFSTPVEISGSEKVQKFEISLPPTVGDKAPALFLENIRTGEKLESASLTNRWILLDFWSITCPPCQKPLTELDDLYGRKKSLWTNYVAFLPVSLDQDKTQLIRHFEKSGWKNLDQFYSSGSENLEKIAGDKIYRIDQIPTSILINPAGRIVWRGHPGPQNFERLFHRLLGGDLAALDELR